MTRRPEMSDAGLPSAFDHPTALASRASMLRAMQRQHGNAHVQHLLSRRPAGQITAIDSGGRSGCRIRGGCPATEVAPTGITRSNDFSRSPRPDVTEVVATVASTGEDSVAAKTKQDEAAAAKRRAETVVDALHAATPHAPALGSQLPSPARGAAGGEVRPPAGSPGEARRTLEADAARPDAASAKPAGKTPTAHASSGKTAASTAASPTAASGRPPTPTAGSVPTPAGKAKTAAAGAPPPETELETQAAAKQAKAEKQGKTDPVPGNKSRATAQPGKGGAPAASAQTGDQPAGGDAGGEVASDGIASYQVKLANTISAIPRPKLGPAAAGADRIGAAGKTAVAGHGAKRASLSKEAQAAVPESPKMKNPLPAEKDPVPEAAELVNKASNRALDPQPMPTLTNSPMGTKPVIGTAPVPEPRPGDPPPEPPQKKEAETKEAEAKKKAAAEKAKKGTDKKPDEKPKEGEGKPLDPMVIEDKPPPVMPPLPKPFKANMGKVLAHLLANTQQEAEAIVNGRTQGRPAQGRPRPDLPGFRQRSGGRSGRDADDTTQRCGGGGRHR